MINKPTWTTSRSERITIDSHGAYGVAGERSRKKSASSPALKEGSLKKPAIAHWAALPLRLIVGYGFVAHGYAKIAKGPVHFIAILHALGVPAPELMGWLTILVEIAGGIAVLVGAFVPLFSLPMAAILLVAMITVHLPYGFSSIKLRAVTSSGVQFGPPGYEVDLLYLACLAALLLGGSGPFTVQAMIGRLKRKSAR